MLVIGKQISNNLSELSLSLGEVNSTLLPAEIVKDSSLAHFVVFLMTLAYTLSEGHSRAKAMPTTLEIPRTQSTDKRNNYEKTHNHRVREILHSPFFSWNSIGTQP